MKRKKIILAAIALFAILVVGGATAYFTDTEKTTNTFTLGSVDITLTEEHWVAANAQGILPGKTLPKDPRVTNVGESSAYVFLKVQEPCYNTTKVFSYTPNSAWTVVGTAPTCSATGTIETTYAYGNSSAMTELAKDANTGDFFTDVTLVDTLDATAVTALNTQFPDGLDVVVTAYAIQKDNLGLDSDTPVAVWAKYTASTTTP